MLRRAAFASRVVASIPIVFPLTRSAVARTCTIQLNTARRVSTSISRRVREIVECAGGASARLRPKEAAQGEGIGRLPGDAALRIDVFEVPDQQQTEVRARC